MRTLKIKTAVEGDFESDDVAERNALVSAALLKHAGTVRDFDIAEPQSSHFERLVCLRCAERMPMLRRLKAAGYHTEEIQSLPRCRTVSHWDFNNINGLHEDFADALRSPQLRRVAFAAPDVTPSILAALCKP